MQRLLEAKTPSTNAKRLHLPAVLVCILISAYFALVVLPRLAIEEPNSEPTKATRAVTASPLQRPTDATTTTGSTSSSGGDPADPDVRPGEIPALHPWGYNSDRNLARWKVLYQSIARDNRKMFSLMDYGSDQGFFSVSVAKFFPKAFVMGLEMGGCGGEIWKKHCDVLLVQEKEISQRHLTNMRICQTMAHQDHFTKLLAGGMMHDYQLVLSVFHWFKLANRKEFEAAIVTLLKNAKTTFIELPTIGDSGSIIRKQVNYESFKLWYDGRTNIGQIIRDAAANHNFKVNVTLLVELPWVQKYTREVYRVDQVGETGDENFINTPVRNAEVYKCEERRKIYGCKTRDLYADCPANLFA